MVHLNNQQLKQWSIILSEHMPHLSIPQLQGLATWSFGMVMTNSSSVDRISEFIAILNEEKPNTVRQRLKEWYQDAKVKKGKKRTEIDVTTCESTLTQMGIEFRGCFQSENGSKKAHMVYAKDTQSNSPM